jgi:hypothetical protein
LRLGSSKSRRGEDNVRSPQVCFFGTLAAFLAIGFPATAAPLSDVLHLADGSVVSGSIVEEQPGRSYTVETVEGEKVVCRVEQVQRIEKRLEPAESAIQQRSIVFLADGVVFKGMVVERSPGGPVVLELGNGRLLHLVAEEIAKIASEPVAGGVAKERPLAPAATRKAMVEFQIAFVRKQVEDAEQRVKEAAQGSDTRAALENELARLRQEFEALSAELERADEEASRAEQGEREFEEELGEIASGIQDARGEVASRVEGCTVPGLRDRMRETLAEIDRKTAEIVQRTEVISRIVEPDPRLVPIEQAEALDELLGMTRNRLWDDPAFREEFAAAVASVPREARQRIYRDNERNDQRRTMRLNAIPFLAIGSWVQGDVLGASIGLVSMIGGMLCQLVSAFLQPSIASFVTPLGISGTAVSALGYAFALYRPGRFVTRSNEELAKALGLRPGGGAP